MRKYQDILSSNRVQKHIAMCLISGFRRYEDEIWTLLGYYTVYSGNLLPTFRDPHTRRNIPEERRLQQSELCQASTCRYARNVCSIYICVLSFIWG